MHRPEKISFNAFDELARNCFFQNSSRPYYISSLCDHLKDGDYRVTHLKFDNSEASYILWNFLLSENARLHKAKNSGRKIIGTMKDLGTIPVIAYSFDKLTAFYPDGAWWTPCIMEMNDGLFAIADSIGIDESFCPVRAMLGAFINQEHFPVPDLLICSVGATCDDFSVIAQRLENLGNEILWWEIPHRRTPSSSETAITLPGGFKAPEILISFVAEELQRIQKRLEDTAGYLLSDKQLSDGITKANRVRKILNKLKSLVFTAPKCPLPALEMLVAEMLSIHFCSDIDESIIVLSALLEEVEKRVNNNTGMLPENNVRVFWVNPAADLRVMNLLEDCGGRLSGTDYFFFHALDEIPENIAPHTALAMMALADPMVGSSGERAERIFREINKYSAEAVVISRIPGASHCAFEGGIIMEYLNKKLSIPVVEIEVPPICDAMNPSIKTRIEALIETALEHRKMKCRTPVMLSST